MGTSLPERKHYTLSDIAADTQRRVAEVLGSEPSSLLQKKGKGRPRVRPALKQDARVHQRLVSLGIGWLRSLKGCIIALREVPVGTGEVPDCLGFFAAGKNADPYSVLVDCKASHDAFCNDRFKRYRQHPELGVGEFRFYFCEENVIRVDELPEHWGLLYAPDKQCESACISVVKAPTGWSAEPAEVSRSRSPFAEMGIASRERLLLAGAVRHILQGGLRVTVESLDK